MNAPVGHHPAKTGFVAADAAANFAGFARKDLRRPGGVGNQLAAHCGAVDPAGFQLGFDEIGVGQPAATARCAASPKASVIRFTFFSGRPVI